MNVENENMYHNLSETGYWSGSEYTLKPIHAKNVSEEISLIPIGLKEKEGHLFMVMSTNNGGPLDVAINNIPGLKEVKGNSSENPNEIDNEPLIEIRYFIKGKLEETTRRIRPTDVKFGIFGSTGENSPGHRSLGESADFYLVGEHTVHPKEKAERTFPFWRIGVYGDPSKLESEYLPEPQRA